MNIKIGLFVSTVAAVILYGALAGQAERYVDITTTEGKEPSVRCTSGELVYVESLRESRWQGRYWSADGRINVSYEAFAADAFAITLNGLKLDGGWKVDAMEEVQPTKRGARHYVVTLDHATHPVGVKVHTLLDGTPVLVRWLELINNGKNPVTLTEVYPMTGRLWPYKPGHGPHPGLYDDPELYRFRMGKEFSMGHFTRPHWAHEGWFEWQKLRQGTTEVLSDKGTSHDDPFFIVRNDDIGEYFIGHLAWTANWKMEFKRDGEGLTFGIGPSAEIALRVIEPSETIATPRVHLGHVSGTMDDAVQAMHTHLRQSTLPNRPDDRKYLIEYLVPADQGYYVPFDEASALKCVDVAQAIGAELFILDAYWWDVTLDWQPSAKRFPNGLKPLVDYVHDKGMLFGLYVETEGARGNIPESRIYKEHPEWFSPKNVIQLSNPEAAKWVEAETRKMIEAWDLDLLRLDYNPLWTHQGMTSSRDGIEENNYWRYYMTFYDMYERIHEDYPKLILQQCSAGGARNDLGVASRFHEIYLTDGLSLPLELLDYAGLTLGLPPENFVILHGADGSTGMGKPQPLDTILRMTYGVSTPMVFVGIVAPNVEKLSPQRRARFLHYGKIYKNFIRPLIDECRMYHHAPINDDQGVNDGDLFAVEYAAPDRTKGWAVLIRVDVKHPNVDRFRFRPRGLDPGRTYAVTFDRWDSTARMKGVELMSSGLEIELEDMAESELLLFEVVK